MSGTPSPEIAGDGVGVAAQDAAALPGSALSQSSLSQPLRAAPANAADRLAWLLHLIDNCEAAPALAQADIIVNVSLAIGKRHWDVERFLAVEAFMDAALAILPEGASWRRYTDGGCSVYAASPYNAKAQVRFDGHTDVASLSLCAAILRLRHAHEAKKFAALAESNK